MRYGKVMACLLSVALTVSAFSGCAVLENGGNGKDEETRKITLTVWGPEEEQTSVDGYNEGILKTMCDKFNKEHPEWDITFKYGMVSEADARDEVVKDVSKAADVYMYANDQIPALVDAGALAKLDDNAVNTVRIDNDESMAASVQYNNDMYGVPFTSNTWFMYYDKSKFTENEVKYLDTMMAKDLGDGVQNFAFQMDKGWYLASFYYAVGCMLFGAGTNADAGCDFDNENGVAVTRYLAELTKNKKFSFEVDGSSIAKFEDGTLGAYCSGAWDAVAIRKALGGNFGVTTTPKISVNGKEGTLKSYAGSKAIGVNPKCKDLDVAMELALYLGNKECQQIRFYTRGTAPTNNEVAESETVKENVVAATQNEQIDKCSVLQPVLEEMDAFWDPTEKMGKELVKGKVTKKNAEEKTKEMVKGILAKP